MHNSAVLRLAAASLACALAAPLFAQQQTFRVFGYVSGRGVAVESQPSWLEGGFGRLTYGGRDAGDHRNLGEAVGQIAIEWTPSRYFDAHVDGLARTKPSGYRGRNAGLVEAYVDGHAFLGDTDEFQLRAGQFFLGTSRENKGELWTSPYTVTLSALNSWVAEEFRPLGAELQWKHGFYTTVAVTAFRGNDTSGALLAWRGWSMGNRISLYNEVLPLPPLVSLRPTGPFKNQRDDGTKPFGHDLDGRTGFAERARFTLPERGAIQFAHVDNRGDRRLYDGEYAWQTKFDVAGLELGNANATILTAEYMTGTTGMGLPDPSPNVDVAFRAAYALLSHKRGRSRWSARYDVFSAHDRIKARPAYYERGHGATVAWMYEMTEHVRGALEYSTVKGRRNAAQLAGFDPDTDGRTVIAEVRYRF